MQGTGFEQVLHHVGGVGPQHHQLAMGHVDDSHQAKNNGQTQGRQHQHRTDGQAVEQGVKQGSHGPGNSQFKLEHIINKKGEEGDFNLPPAPAVD